MRSKQEDTGNNSDEDESEESYKELPLEEDRDDEDEDDEYTLIEEKESDAGNAVNRDIRTVEEIGASAPLIDWRVILPNTINYGVDWSYSTPFWKTTSSDLSWRTSHPGNGNHPGYQLVSGRRPAENF